jgi:hypothetical protein
MLRRIQAREECFGGEAVGTVLVALPSLVAYDIALGLELCVSDCRQESAHAVGLEPESELESMRRH